MNVFAFANGAKKEVFSGSHIEIKGFNVVSGVAAKTTQGPADITTGAFIEYAKGKYDSFLDDGTKGSGDTQAIGGGVFGKVQSSSGSYVDASFRVGEVKSDYETTAAYEGFKLSNTYYGAHIGIGHEFNLGTNILEIYARGIYGYTASNDIKLAGLDVSFDSVKSLRTQVGVKDSIALNDVSKLYIGSAYQYEFDGESNGEIALTGFGSSAIASPKLKGSTGIGEIGYIYENGTVKFDIGAKGYVGKERGYSGNLGITFNI